MSPAFSLQKSLRKFFMTSQQTFTCSKSTWETSRQVDVILMSLFFTIADFKQENFYLDTFNWLWNYIHYIIFFQMIKRCCQVHVQPTSMFEIISIGMFQKEAIFVTFRICYMRKDLPCLGEYPTPLDVSDISNLFYFHFAFTWSRAMTCLLTEIQFYQPGETVMRMLMYQFKLTKSQICFHHVAMNMCLVWWDGTDFI